MEVIDHKGRRKVSPGWPVGTVTPFYGTAVPAGWRICDGTGGTPDLTDRFIAGDTVVGTGTAGGATSATAALTHSGSTVANHANHVPTQPAAHSNHAVTELSAHSNHTVTQPADHGTHSSQGAHTHDAHTTATRTAAGVSSEVTGPATHASQGAHTHDAHSAHTGAAVDAHSAHAGSAVDAHSAHSGFAVDAHSAHAITEPGAHSIYKTYSLCYVMYVS